jgi:hypothetical protein
MLGKNLAPQKACPYLLMLALLGNLVLVAAVCRRGSRLLLRGVREHGGGVAEVHCRVLG